MTRNANGTPDNNKDESSTNINVMVPSTTSSSSQQSQQQSAVSDTGAIDDDDDDDDDNKEIISVDVNEGEIMEMAVERNDMKSSSWNQRNSLDIDFSLPLDSPIIITKFDNYPSDRKPTKINKSTSKNCDNISNNNNNNSNKRLISKHEMKEFRDAFRLFDKDGDGTITKEELGSVMRSLGQFARGGEIQEMLQEIDADGDGNVSFEEFVDILSNMTDATTETSAAQEERELRDAFRVFDKHNRGYITASDLRAVLQCLGEDLDEDEIEDMIKEVDVDGDGKIDFFEFVHALTEPEDSQDGDEDDDDDDDDDEDDEEDNITSPLTPQKSIVSPIP